VAGCSTDVHAAMLFVILKQCRYLNELERCHEGASFLNFTAPLSVAQFTFVTTQKDFLRRSSSYRIRNTVYETTCKINLRQTNVDSAVEELVPSLDRKRQPKNKCCKESVKNVFMLQIT
jgi:hypothetical protein